MPFAVVASAWDAASASRRTSAARRCRSSSSSATVKRDIPVASLSALIDDIESSLRDGGTLEVSSVDLGSMVLKRLISVDKVAYVRFASVYRDFKDVDEFSEELRSLHD